MNELKQFKDLVFKQHEMTKDAFLLPSSIREEYMNAKHAKMQFENGYGISVLKVLCFTPTVLILMRLQFLIIMEFAITLQ